MEDKNSHMRMLNISGIDDLIPNSMDILEPAPVDADGNKREDGICSQSLPWIIALIPKKYKYLFIFSFFPFLVLFLTSYHYKWSNVVYLNATTMKNWF